MINHSDTLESSFTGMPCNASVLLGIFVIFFTLLLVNYIYSNNTKDNDRKERNKKIHFHQLQTPFGFPIVGHLTRLGTLPHLVLSKWAKKFGPMFRIKMGFQEVLIISGTENIKKALTKKNAFAGRPDLETSKLISEGLSLTFSDYSQTWEHQKVAAKAAVRMYTSGKDLTKRSVMESSSFKHANDLVDELIQLANKEDGVLNPRDTILIHATSAVCAVCFGQEFDSRNPKLRKLLSINENFGQAMSANQPVNFWPVLQHFPLVATSFQKLRTYSKAYWNFITSMLEAHWEKYNDEPIEDAQDLVDCLYNESDKARRNNNNETPAAEKNGLKSHLDRKKLECNGHGVASKDDISNKYDQYEKSSYQGSVFNPIYSADKETEFELQKRIIYNVGDIFGAGFDTLFSTLYWSLLYMAVYPDTQVKVREEVNQAIGPDQAPSHRFHSNKCPYTMAWIYEMMRHLTPSPLLLPHRTTQQIEFNNCVIPAGVTVYFNVWEAHREPEIWNNPEEFNPERFLTKKEDGSLGLKANSTANLFSWGAGKRKCLGYDLSRQQLFIFICTIIRRLDVKPFQVGVEPTLPWPSNFGLALKPKLFRIRVTERADN